MVFHIHPNEHALVTTLCGTNANNNLEAVKYWLEAKLTNENKAEEAAFWEGELSKELNELTGFC